MELSLYEKLHSLIDFNPETGSTKWKFREEIAETQHKLANIIGFNRRFAGKECFSCVRDDGYVHGAINEKKYLKHRIVWFMHYGEWPNGGLDHINGDKTDNRIANLREATPSQNQYNRPSLGKLRGAHYRKSDGMWQSSIRVENKRIYLGIFACADDAHKAYCEAQTKYHAEYSYQAKEALK